MSKTPRADGCRGCGLASPVSSCPDLSHPLMPESAVLAENLGKTFIKRRSLRETVAHPWSKATRVIALQDVTFQAARGEIFGLHGPNGAGKTTLLKILSCLILPTTGRAVVGGHDTSQAEARVKSSIGFVTS